MSETIIRGKKVDPKQGMEITIGPYSSKRYFPFPPFEEFLEGTLRGVLLIRNCRKCGAAFAPGRICCPVCLSMDREWRQASGEGRVYSYTVVRQAFTKRLETLVPYVLALIELKENVYLLSQVVNCRPEVVQINMSVKVVFKDLDGVRMPFFEPVDV